MVEVGYVDSSVFVKLYDASETDAAAARGRVGELRAAASVLLLAEVMSALARKSRVGRLDAAAVREIRKDVHRDYREVLKVRLNLTVLREAERLLFGHSFIRASDAVHLASALLVARDQDEPLPFLTADGVLADAASVEGLAVERFLPSGVGGR